ncbi:MAG: glycosyltransferase [Clostridia bacterium]|nr:glycosyltransferase [Clostridia bacterium]
MNYSDILVSVIVPVYNREKDLPALVESVLACKDPRLELLLVNDGSTDGSLAVCKNLAAEDNRVTVINKPNGGVSSARNTGIGSAKGKYLFFCDSDDLVVTETLASALELAEAHSEDLLIFDFQYYFLNNGTTKKSSFVLPPEHTFRKDDIVSLLLEPLVTREATDLAGVWHKLFRTRTLNATGIRFEEKVARGEDWRFIVDFFDAAETAFYTPKILYTYRLDGSQVPSKYARKPGLHQLGSIDRKLSLIEKYDLPFSEDRKLRLYHSYLVEIAYAARNNCPRYELREMMRAQRVQIAVKALRALSRKQKDEIGFFRREGLFSFCVRYKLALLSRIVAKKLYKEV